MEFLVFDRVKTLCNHMTIERVNVLSNTARTLTRVTAAKKSCILDRMKTATSNRAEECFS